VLLRGKDKLFLGMTLSENSTAEKDTKLSPKREFAASLILPNIWSCRKKFPQYKLLTKVCDLLAKHAAHCDEPLNKTQNRRL
jgi:hypothetical protein